jgi:2-polyprenyl-6-hydroxyphenyl methylase/3-demethylubiquinone-9 3-methyltransferase
MMAAGQYWWEEPDSERALVCYLASRDNSYDRWKSWSVRKLIPRPRRAGSLALDYGCGGGEFTVWLAAHGWRVVAGDASKYSLNACRLYVKQRKLTQAVQFVHTAPPDYWGPLGRQFDLILAKDVIEHIEDDIRFLRQMKSHLASDGTAVIVTQNDHSWNYRLEAPAMLARDSQWRGWDPTHVRFYNRQSLERKLLHVGLRPIRWRATYVIPYWAWRSRLMKRIRRLAERTVGLGVFHLPETLLGEIWPVCNWGWSIAVGCVHENA